MTNPEFLFDFGSPNAWLAHLVLPDIEARTGVTFTRTPVLLGGIFRATGNRSPAEAFANIRNKMDYERREMERFISRHGITRFRFNPYFPVNTLQLMRGAVAAQRENVFAPYVEAVFSAMWEQPRKMDDPDVFRAALADAGLPIERLLQRAADQDVKDELLANTNQAVERGVFGIPSFFVGDELYFGKDRLRDVEEDIVRTRNASRGDAA
ncbi:DSBA oxidoreductase [Camelimonas fluminis]|uniref:2-hydroxychromene-2-carboxylate isomerase n=1 Tax=Camelimonas fluminis TaxID=1576911 RepID=A0ABV7UIL9_9HYPH|nr:2-hydroxychromene-2-carboxylate isomerase [Camelimonas fluminis]GHE67952.1 DSBA oxidoreductase [Camelimonas fluminis]